LEISEILDLATITFWYYIKNVPIFCSKRFETDIFRAKNTNLIEEGHGQMARAKQHFLQGHVGRKIDSRFHKKFRSIAARTVLCLIIETKSLIAIFINIAYGAKN